MISDNRQKLLQQIAGACRKNGRSPSDVQLMAASKQQSVDVIESAIAAGQILFGENRVQEAQAKWPDIKRRHPHVRLHLIGLLQSNKTRAALEIFDGIQSIDRDSIIDTILKYPNLCSGKEFFIQINIGSEAQKSGIMPGDADAFIARASRQLPVVGLMAIPPLDADPAPHFHALASMAKKHHLAQLSMGMSADLDVAIACGATMVRVGTALFGARPTVKA